MEFAETDGRSRSITRVQTQPVTRPPTKLLSLSSTIYHPPPQHFHHNAPHSCILEHSRAHGSVPPPTDLQSRAAARRYRRPCPAHTVRTRGGCGDQRPPALGRPGLPKDCKFLLNSQNLQATDTRPYTGGLGHLDHPAGTMGGDREHRGG